MPELQKEIFRFPLSERTGGEKVQMPKVRESEEPAGVRRLLCQDFEKKLKRLWGGLH
jgi:hypothetical protein